MAWLSQPDNTAWLLIFDNVDREYDLCSRTDPDAYDVCRYFSGPDHGSILITSRIARLEQPGEATKVGKVSRVQGEAIFRTRLGRVHSKALIVMDQRGAVNTDGNAGSTECETLLCLLDDLPLAIAQAGAFIQESGVEIGLYIEFYELQFEKLMDRGDNILQDYHSSVWTTWTISYNEIRKRDYCTANLLLLWSLLDNKDLWHGLFAAACNASALIARLLRDWIGDIAIDELEFVRAMTPLRNYSLIEDIGPGTVYSTHPVVHKWAYHFQDHNSLAELAHLAVMVVGSVVPSSAEEEYWALQGRLLPHARACSRWLSAHQGDGIFGQEWGHLEKRSEEQETLASVHGIAMIFFNQGKMEEAARIFKSVLDKSECILGEGHPETIRAMIALAITLRELGDLDDSAKMAKEGLKKSKRILGDEHLDTIFAMNALASTLGERGQLNRAVKMKREALDLSKQVLGEEHKETISAMNNLANTLGLRGEFGESAALFREVVEKSTRTLGEKHLNTLQALNNLAITLCNQGRGEEAIALSERAVERMRNVYGEGHFTAVATRTLTWLKQQLQPTPRHSKLVAQL